MLKEQMEALTEMVRKHQQGREENAILFQAARILAKRNNRATLRTRIGNTHVQIELSAEWFER